MYSTTEIKLLANLQTQTRQCFDDIFELVQQEPELSAFHLLTRQKID